MSTINWSSEEEKAAYRSLFRKLTPFTVYEMFEEAPHHLEAAYELGLVKRPYFTSRLLNAIGVYLRLYLTRSNHR